jgi:dethiobiotin synthetase
VIVVVTGTGTDVGKTYVTAALARTLRARGVEVHARKPVQSFAPGEATTDADVLATATGEDTELVCPPHRRLPIPMAPPMAAAALGKPPFTIADLVAGMDMPSGGITFVEGAGGVLSPLAHDGDTRTLIEHVRPAQIVLVADASLGAINLVRLSAEALAAFGPPLVFLNRYVAGDDLHRRNAAWLSENAGLDVYCDPESAADRLATPANRTNQER